MNPGENEESAIDAIFETLSHEHRRIILEFLSKQLERDVDCADVVQYLSHHDTSGTDYETLDIQCHHSHFPKLEEAGLISHDVQRRTIHSKRSGTIEDLVELMEKLEE